MISNKINRKINLNEVFFTNLFIITLQKCYRKRAYLASGVQTKNMLFYYNNQDTLFF
jgi:hypothetical protein